jgi:hypothetical protein
VLDDTKLLMKGLPQHDDDLKQTLLNDEHVVVLWPDNVINRQISNNDKQQQQNDYCSNKSTEHNRITWEELQTNLMIEHECNFGSSMNSNYHQVTLLVLEGTWRTARRMISKLPATIQRLSLPPNVLFWSSTPSQSSVPIVVDNSDDDNDDYVFIKNNENTRTKLQRSLRIQGKGGSTYNLCSAEAVTAALVGLGLTHNDGHRILDLVQKKVNMTLQYQGKT